MVSVELHFGMAICVGYTNKLFILWPVPVLFLKNMFFCFSFSVKTVVVTAPFPLTTDVTVEHTDVRVPHPFLTVGVCYVNINFVLHSELLIGP